MLQITSRYKATSETRNGENTVIAVRGPVVVSNYTTHISRDGDSFGSLSSRYLGSPTYYWRIADMNPHVPFPDYIPVGTILRIPR